MQTKMGGKVVCVTGATGYIASWVVKLLLELGYIVKATVRSLGDPAKVQHLKDLQGGNERLHLYEADLLEEGSFDAAVEGCEGVFHTASPVLLLPSDPQTELIDPAVKGTINVLTSCKKASTVKRVVVTSSIATVVQNIVSPVSPDAVVDETWHSDPKLCEKHQLWYDVSKILAEAAAWEFAGENGLDLVTLHPGVVLGPLLRPTLCASTGALVYLIQCGKTPIPGEAFHTVDVRDVALAHLLAFENPSASGRYCLVERDARVCETLQILNAISPSLKIPVRHDAKKQPPCFVSRKKAEGLGISFIPLQVTLKDALESLKEKGFITS